MIKITCKYCHKSLAECREADKQLITPVNQWVADFRTPAEYTTRSLKAFAYKIGLYNSVLDTFYQIHSFVSYRTIRDTFLSLPLCVWKTEEEYNERNEIINIVQNRNLNVIPIKKEYITNLKKLKPDALELTL